MNHSRQHRSSGHACSAPNRTEQGGARRPHNNANLLITLIALGSKLPHAGDSHGSVAATVGTFDLYRFDGDVGGALSADGSVLYRVSGTVNGAHTQQTFGDRQRTSLSPAITFGAGSDTTLTVLAALSHDPRNGNYGVQPLSGTVDSNPNGQISRQFADGEPALQRYSRDQEALTYLFDRQFGNGWALHSSGRFQRVSATAQGVYTTGIPTDASLAIFGRGSLRTNEGLSDWTFDNRLDGGVATGPVTHKLLFGIDYQHAASNEGAGFGTATDIDAYAPVYGTTTELPATTSFYQVRQRQLGLYAQDQLALGGLRLTLSGRYDQTRGRLQEATSATDDQKNDHKLSDRVGALYLFDNGLAPYASLSTSFEPQSSSVTRADGSTGIADPSVGSSWRPASSTGPPARASCSRPPFSESTRPTSSSATRSRSRRRRAARCARRASSSRPGCRSCGDWT